MLFILAGGIEISFFDGPAHVLDEIIYYVKDTDRRKLGGWSRTAISRRLAEAVIMDQDMASAVIDVFEELQTAPGQVISIRTVEDVSRQEVSIEACQRITRRKE